MCEDGVRWGKKHKPAYELFYGTPQWTQESVLLLIFCSIPSFVFVFGPLDGIVHVPTDFALDGVREVKRVYVREMDQDKRTSTGGRVGTSWKEERSMIYRRSDIHVNNDYLSVHYAQWHSWKLCRENGLGSSWSSLVNIFVWGRTRRRWKIRSLDKGKYWPYERSWIHLQQRQ